MFRGHRIVSRLCASLVALTAVASMTVFAYATEQEDTENKLTIQVSDCKEKPAEAVTVIVRGKVTVSEDKEENYVAYAVTDKEGVAVVSYEGTELNVTVNAAGIEKEVTLKGKKLSDEITIDGVHDESKATLEEIKAATCTKSGESRITGKCPDCGEKLDRVAETAPLGHDWDKGTVTQEPTCTEKGILHRECQREGCDKTSDKRIPCIDHEEDAPVKENQVKPTCITKGRYEKVVYCAAPDCDYEFSRLSLDVPCSDHTPGDAVKSDEVKATCTEDGSYTETISCKVCGEVLSTEQKTESALGHKAASAVRENEKKATCTAEGSYESVVYCSECGKEMSRETKTESTAAHTPASAVKEKEKKPTCTAKGSYEEVVYCSVCKKEMSRDTIVVAALGHTKADAVRENEEEATCTERGSYESVVYCKTCEEEISRTKKTIKALGHTEAPAVRENVQEATCTKAGSCEAVVKCSVCKEELSRTEQSIPAKGHTSVQDTAVKATCTSMGLTAGYHCSECKMVLVAQNTVAALGHNWDAGVVTKAAAVGQEGVRTYTCRNNAAHTRTEVIPALKPGEEPQGPSVIGNGNGPLILDPTEEQPAASEPNETVEATVAEENVELPQKTPTARKGTFGLFNVLLLLASIGIAAVTFQNQEGGMLRYAAPAPAVLAFILFLASQRPTGRLVFADLWSIPMLILTAGAGVLYFAVAGAFDREDDEDEDEDTSEEEITDLTGFEEI